MIILGGGLVVQLAVQLGSVARQNVRSKPAPVDPRKSWIVFLYKGHNDSFEQKREDERVS